MIGILHRQKPPIRDYRKKQSPAPESQRIILLAQVVTIHSIAGKVEQIFSITEAACKASLLLKTSCFGPGNTPGGMLPVLNFHHNGGISKCAKPILSEFSSQFF